MRKILRCLYFIIGILISFYLLLPPPLLPPPYLPQSVKSNEPGDTKQIANVSAYYTDKSRKEVLKFYTQYFSRSNFLYIPFPTYRLNHPPEYARKVWVDTKRSYYLEEIVHPLRESLFVNGFEWQNDVFTPPEKRAKNKLIAAGKIWSSKVSLRWFYSSTWLRLPLFWISWAVFYLLIIFWQNEIKEFWQTIKKEDG